MNVVYLSMGGILVAKNKSDMRAKVIWASNLTQHEREALSIRVQEVAKKFTKERTRKTLSELNALMELVARYGMP